MSMTQERLLELKSKLRVLKRLKVEDIQELISEVQANMFRRTDPLESPVRTRPKATAEVVEELLTPQVEEDTDSNEWRIQKHLRTLTTRVNLTERMKKHYG